MGTRMWLSFEQRLKITPRGSHIWWGALAADQAPPEGPAKPLPPHSQLTDPGGSGEVVNAGV